MRIAFTTPGGPEQAARIMAEVMREQDYALAQPPTAAGAWSARPRHSWLSHWAKATWRGPAHPGVQLSGEIQPKGDSAEVTVFARTLCRAEGEAGPMGSVEDLLERFTALDLAEEVTKRSNVETPRLRVVLSPPIGEFHYHESVGASSAAKLFQNANHTVAVSIVFSALGPLQYARCTPACAEVAAQRLAANHFEEIAEMGAASSFKSMEVLVPRPGDYWEAARYIVHDSVDGNCLHSHSYVYVFPDRYLIFHGLIGATPGDAEQVRAFVVAALGTAIGQP